MSRFFKSAAFPILIVIVLAFFASKLIQSGNEAPKTNFNTFLNQVDAGDIENVVMRTKDNSVEVTLKGADRKKYTTGVPPAYSDTLVQTLRGATADGKLHRVRRQARPVAA